MRSPFPGMDPYIEACGLWEDFHHTLIAAIRDALLAVVPQRYVVNTGERAYVVLSARRGRGEHAMQTDVGVVSVGRRPTPEQGAATALATAPAATRNPIRMVALVETEFRETFLKIREATPGRRLITCIEVLSPSNKRPGTPGWLKYTRKRQAYLEGRANFVEIDLLRRGQRMPMHDDWPEEPYYALVCRQEEAPDCSVWPADWANPLPEILIPLAPPDVDVPLALQPLVDSIYQRSRYHLQLDYHRRLRPRLKGTDAAWVEQRLREWEAARGAS